MLPRGGIAPITRRRSRLALTLAAREDISRGIASGSSIREIAGGLSRATSTVRREIVRHGGRPAYRAHDADGQAWQWALRPKRCLLVGNPKLRNIVASKLMLDWSPEQISGWLKKQYANDESMRVSHETIYRSLFIQARGVLKKELMDHLRSKRRMRRSRHFSEHGHARGRSSMPSRSANGQRRRKTERSLATGKAICWRSAKPVATWNERKYKSAPATILPTRNRPVRHLSRAARPGRAALEPTPKKNPRIPNSGE
jgi:IS30 family transposase